MYLSKRENLHSSRGMTHSRSAESAPIIDTVSVRPNYFFCKVKNC